MDEKRMPDFIDDPFWKELELLIKAFLQNRIKTVHNDGHVSLCEIANNDVTFTYSSEEVYCTDNKLNEFVKNIMLTLRDK